MIDTDKYEGHTEGPWTRFQPHRASEADWKLIESARDTSGFYTFTDMGNRKWLSPSTIASMLLELKGLSVQDFPDMETHCNRCDSEWESCHCYCDEHDEDYGHCVWDHDGS